MDINRAYKDIELQPIDLIQSYNLPFELENVLKYVMRDKGSDEMDLRKSIDYCELFLNRGGKKTTFDEFIEKNKITGQKLNVILAIKAYEKSKNAGIIELLHTILGIMLNELPEE